MRKSFILAISIVLCMVLSLSATIAYLTEDDSDVNVMTLGQVRIQVEEFQRNEDGGLTYYTDWQTLYPQVGDTEAKDAYGLPENPTFHDKIVRISSDSRNADAYLRVWIGVPTALLSVVDEQDAIHLVDGAGVTLGDESTEENAWGMESKRVSCYIDDVPYTMICFPYNKILTPGEITPPVLAGLYLDKRVDNSDDPNSYVLNHNGAEYALNVDLSRGLQVLVLAQAVQVAGFDSDAQAFKESGMDDVDFNAYLDLEILPSGAVLSLLQMLRNAYAGAAHTNISLSPDDTYDLSTDQMKQAIEGLPASDAFEVNVIVPADRSVTLQLGSTLLPDNLNLHVEEGASLELVGEE